MANFNMLPVDIIFNIISRLPAELVSDCKLVSKSWNRVINYQSFSESHFNRFLNNLDSAGKHTFLLVNNNPLYAYRQFHYLEFYDDDSEKPSHRVTRMRLNPDPFRYYDFTGSCNGLVCLNGGHDNEWVIYEPVYICNPITRECVYLPGIERTDDRAGRLLTGFGYVSETNEYKVVRMCELLKEPNFLHVEVYTLGSGEGWRNIGKKFDKSPGLFESRNGVFVNGALYWVLVDGIIVAFDLVTESFVELPRCFPFGWYFKLGVFGGYLSAEHYDQDSKTTDILLLKENEDGSWGWIQEFSDSLSNTDTREIEDFLALTCRSTVLCHSKTKVLIHDLNSSSSKVLVDFGKDKAIFQAIPHMNTLVSLKALGEENTITMEWVDVPREVVEEYSTEYNRRLGICIQQ